jgi:carbamoyltransferase
MNYIGISAGFHDAAVSLVDHNGEILFAAHSERYSKQKHDRNLCVDLVDDLKKYINSDLCQIDFYERPWLSQILRYRAGQWSWPKSIRTAIGSDVLSTLPQCNIYQHPHHLSHAAAGFQTSPFDCATVVVIDAIGEFDTISIWHAEYDPNGRAQYTKLFNKKYPNSIGLFYSAVTARAGLMPLDEEYILMGMAAYGQPKYVDEMMSILRDPDQLEFRDNLHAGLDDKLLPCVDNYDLAASAQQVLENMIDIVMGLARKLGRSDNLVYSGGVALNCLANRQLGQYFDNIWIMPNPGDAGSALGAAGLGLGKKLNWISPYLGHEIKGQYPVDALYTQLSSNKIAAVASGRAEYGPRALGNRSLLADPRGPEIKDRVNEIKQRQKFRPFAPVILEEFVDQYFDMPRHWSNSRYMQVVAGCRRPDLFPAICHNDNTSRVQTVPADSRSGIRLLLEQWYFNTGCPMLLNTSLNIRGQPMVNDRHDADLFQEKYQVVVCS